MICSLLVVGALAADLDAGAPARGALGLSLFRTRIGGDRAVADGGQQLRLVRHVEVVARCRAATRL